MLHLDEKSNGNATDNGERGGAKAGSTGGGDSRRKLNSAGGRDSRRKLNSAGGGDSRRQSWGLDNGRVPGLGGGPEGSGWDVDRGGVELDAGGGEAGSRSDGGGVVVGSGGGRARGESDSLGANQGGDDDRAVTTVLAVASLDVEGHRVLEDRWVALELEDKAVEGLGAEGSINGPGVALVRVGNAG